MALIQTIAIPLLAVNDTFLTVVEINGITGDYVKNGSNLITLETSKTTYDIEAPATGYVEFLCEIGVDYEVNTIVANIYEHQSDIPLTSSISKPQPAKKINDSSSNSKGDNRILVNWTDKPLFSKAAYDQMKFYDLKEADFNGKVFVGAEDVLAFIGQPAPLPPASSINKLVTRSKSLGIQNDPAKVDLTPVPKNKRTEIEFLSSVQSAGLPSTISVFIETKGLFSRLNNSMRYFKDSLLPVLIYEVARLLRDYKELNAYYTDSGIAFYKSVNVGFAVDMDKGLKVMKIKDAGIKTVQEIESDIFALSEKYIDDQVSLDDIIDINFTITDLSAEGVNSFIPLINFMNSAILGVSAIDNKLERLNLSLTFDHRVTEGKRVANFLSELKQRVESYSIQEGANRSVNIQCFNCNKTLEEDLSGIGFVKVINQQGLENYICQSCFKGF